MVTFLVKRLLFLSEPTEDFSINKASMTRSEKKVKRVPIRYLKALIKANKVRG